MGTPTWLAWSSGKDSACALDGLLDDSSVELRGMFTTVDRDTQRVAFQGTGRELLEIQVAATGLPLRVVEMPPQPDDAVYRRELGQLYDEARKQGIEQIAFGDIHLEDVREWREGLLREYGLRGRFPLWGRDPSSLAREIIDGGIEAMITCVDPRVVDPAWLGRPYDREFLDALAPDLDPCGERGEFHTFVCAGPMLHDRLDIVCADPVEEDDFLVAEPVLGLPLDGTLDLHGIDPKQVGNLVDDWIDASRQAGILHLRIVHGKGIGALRETVHARLRRRDDVAGFRLGGEGAGGWGATLVTLKEPGDEL